MPLLDLQRRLAEIGRIRIGDVIESGGRRRPRKRDSFRLTSRDRTRLEAAQAVHGGEIRDWNGQFELDTPATALPVMLIPGQELSQWYELWGSPGAQQAVSCLRRCDGEHEVLSDGPCKCPPADERRDLAANGKACKPTTRLSVLLPDVPGIGCWRLETHGYYAAVELAGASHILQQATAQGVLFPARLRLDQRESRKGGQVRKFAVPVIEVDVAPTEVLALSSVHPRAALPEARIDRDGQKRLFEAAKASRFTEDGIRAILRQIAGVEASADVPVSKLDAVLAAITERVGG